MRIRRDNYYGQVEFGSIKEAVEDATTLSAYMYDGQLEGLKQEIELLRELISRLVEQLSLNKDQIKAVLGCGYEVYND